jgi:hypothetical protein
MVGSKDSQVKTQLVLWIFILFKVTTCFGLYHQAIIRSQVKTYVFLCFNNFVAYTPPYTHRQRYINKDKIVPNADNFMIFAILHFYNFIPVTDTTVQINDNKISLHFKPMRLIFISYNV